MDIDMPLVKQNGSSTPNHAASNGHNGSRTPGPNTPAEEAGLSARQLNQLKRKRKREAQHAGTKNRLVDLSIRRQNTAGAEPGQDVIMTDDGPEDTNGKGVSDYFSLERSSDVDES